MCNPIGVFRSSDGAALADLYNLWLSIEPGTEVIHRLMPWASLFVLLVLVASLLTIAIFLFKRRALQMRIVNFCMIVLLGYYLVGGFFLWHFLNQNPYAFRPTVWVAMPLFGAIFCYLAFRGILKDQMLIKSLDRLR